MGSVVHRLPLSGETSNAEYTTKGSRKRHKICFGWYGGKYNHLNWLLPLLPTAHHYCEPFGGSAAVLLNREPSPVETSRHITIWTVRLSTSSGFFAIRPTSSSRLLR